MTIAVASGKGGTGKTTIAANLARAFADPVQLLDADVEEPNAHLLLPGQLRTSREVTRLVPQVDEARCDSCGQCAEFCQSNAIVALPRAAMVFPELCHACGGCSLHCPRGAISEVEARLGVVETFDCGAITLIQGRLDVGQPTAPPVVREARAQLRSELPTIIDAPPGTSCPVVAAVRDVDYAVLVTEPTPFGLHDLALAVALVRALDVPHGVVLNRTGLGDGRVQSWCVAEGLEILLELPEDRRIAEAYARGELLVEALPEYRARFEQLAQRLLVAGVAA